MNPRIEYLSKMEDIIMNNFLRCSLLLCTAISLSSSGEVFNFSDSAFSFLQNTGAIMHPDAAMISQPVKCFDMGSTGSVEIPNVAIPQGPFSIESRFYVRGYNETDPNISEVLAAFDCGSGTEGTDFRVGGGYNYALKIQDVYNNFSDWNRPDDFEKTARAAVSKAVGEFALGSGQGAWKEAFTDRCIETNKWMHMVATWDGTNMLLYLNGHNATDAWRTIGSALPAYIKSSRTVMIGAQTVDAWRHINGMIKYVKIYSQAFSQCQVWQNYRQSLGNEQCADFIKIESPLCGEVISPVTKIKFGVKDSADNDITPSGQSFTVQVCRDPTFTDSVRSYLTSTTQCTFGNLVGDDYWDFEGLLYFRISTGNQSVLNKKTSVAPATSGSIGAASGMISAYLLNSASKIAKPGYIGKGLAGVKQFSGAAIFDIRGRMVNAGAKSLAQMKNGVYFVKTANGAGQKILFTK